MTDFNKKPMMGMPPMGKPPAGMSPMGGDKPFGTGGPPAGWEPPMADISWVKNKRLDIPYAGESKAQCLDLYFPEKGEGPFPLLVHIHGGGFAFGDKRDDHMDAYLTGIRRGYAVASIEYRLSGEAKFPAAVLDCRAAIRYLREHAAELGIDPERIAVIGGSAGGNLTAMLAMNVPNGEFPGEENKSFAVQPFVAAAVDQFGPMNFKTMDEQARGNGVSFADHDAPTSPESQYLGVTIGEASQEQCDVANPLYYAGGNMCPLLVQHGTLDHLVPYEQSVEFIEGLRQKAGEDAITFLPLEGADHEDKMFTSQENLSTVFEFLRKNL